MSAADWLLAIVQALLWPLAAPLLVGWVRKIKALMQNRRGASVLQPARNLGKLFTKETRVANTASPLFRMTPYIVFTATWLAAAAVPLISTHLPTSALADVIVIAGLLGLARFFLALVGMDVGTAFGGMGASREMMVSGLAEPALLMAVFTLAMSAHSTNLSSVVVHQLAGGTLLPSMLFALGSLILVAVAETGRIPIDNPSTHLELTMIHEAMVLEYSGRHLALLEWAAQIRLLLYGALIANVFIPWGIATTAHPFEQGIGELGIAIGALAGKLLVLGAALAVGETVLAKKRLFQAPAFLSLAFLFALIGLLSYVILEQGM